MRKKKKEFSKKLCIISIFIFVISLIGSFILAFLNMAEGFAPYLIPTTGAILAATIGFYLNKAKIENLSKQKLRNVLLKLVLEDKLSEEDYEEILCQIEEIDSTIEEKLSSMYNQAVEEETNVDI